MIDAAPAYKNKHVIRFGVTAQGVDLLAVTKTALKTNCK